MMHDPDKIRELAEAVVGAWNSMNPDAVAESYAEQTRFSINRGEPMRSRAEISEMAAGFMRDFPDMVLHCDSILSAGNHAIYTWTFEGHHKDTGKAVRFSGWEEWEIGDDLKVDSSAGWFDEADFQRQLEDR